MASRIWDTVENAGAQYDAYAQQEQSANAYAQVDGMDLATRLDRIGRAANWLSADAALSLAQAGMDPSDPEFYEVAREAGKLKSKKGFGWHSVGDAVKAVARTAGKGFETIGSVIPEPVRDVVSDDAYTVAKGTIRGAGDVLSYFPQAGQGIVREAQAAKREGRMPQLDNVLDQTTAGQIGKAALDPDKKVETGSGFFTPETSPIGQARVTAERDAWTLNGKAWSLGRGVASEVFEPDTKPYNFLSGLIDAAVVIGMDPTTFATGALTKGAKAAKAFNPDGKATLGQGIKDNDLVSTQSYIDWRNQGDNLSLGRDEAIAKYRDEAGLNGTPRTRFLGRLKEDELLDSTRFKNWREREAPDADDNEALSLFKENVGLIDGNRKAIATHRVEAWLGSEDGAKMGTWLANADFKELYNKLGEKVDADALAVFADIKDPQEALATLKPMLGIQKGFESKPNMRITNTATFANAGNLLARKDPKSARLFKMMPDVRGIDPHDANQATRQIDLHARNAKMRDSKRLEWVEKMARSTSPIQRFNLVEEFVSDIAVEVSTKPIDPKVGLAEGNKITLGDDTGEVLEVMDDGKVMVRLDDRRKSVVTANQEELRLKGNVSPKEARALTKLYSNYNKAEREYWIDSLSGTTKAVPHVDLDGPTPHMYNEFINNVIPMPDARMIRRATKKFGHLLGEPEFHVGKRPKEITYSVDSDDVEIFTKKDAKGRKRQFARVERDGVVKEVQVAKGTDEFTVAWEGSQKTVKVPVAKGLQLAEYLAVDLWKAAALLRAAYTVRVEGESQLRMAAAGYSTLIHHPIDYFQIYRHKKMASGMTGAKFKDESDLLRGADEYGAAMTRTSDYRQGGAVAGVMDVKYLRDDIGNRENYLRSRADNLMQAHTDELTSRIAGGRWGKDSDIPDPFEATFEWSWSGPGKKFRLEMAEGGRGREVFANDAGAWRDYLESLRTRIGEITNDDPDLIGAIANGRFDGAPLFTGAKPQENLLAYLEDLADNDIGPKFVMGQRNRDGFEKGHPMQNLDNAVAHAFSFFAGKPSNKFSRSPVFRQAYWDKAEELFPFMDDASQAKAIKAAEQAKIGRVGDDQIARMKAIAADGSGDMTLEEADLLAKLNGLKQTQDLLYDLSRRSQFFDAYRVAFPFGDAWLEVLSTWTKLVKDNPEIVRRGQLTVYGARSADMDGDGRGFFYKDPTTGEEMFAVPGVKFLTEKMFGQPMGYDSPVKGLNIFGTVIPGVGPVVGIPAGELIEDIPEFSDAHRLLFPFGTPDTESGFESYWPAYLKKIGASFTGGKVVNEKQFNTLVVSIQAQMYANGVYNFDDPEDVERSKGEAVKRARVYSFFQGLAQSALPSPPTTDLLTMDPSGQLLQIEMLRNDLNEMYKEDRLREEKGETVERPAMMRFLDKWGTRGIFAATSTSEQVKGFVPRTKTGGQFAKEYADQTELYGDVYGLFSGPGNEDEFDNPEYQRQIASGETRKLTQDEMVARAQANLGNTLYKQAQLQVEGRNDAQSKAWLAEVKKQIGLDYPGYLQQEWANQSTTGTIQQLDRAWKNSSKLAQTDAGKGYAIYREARQKALDTAKQRGLNSGVADADRAQDLRDWLDSVAKAIIVEHPDFAHMYDAVLSRETQKKVK